MATRDLSAFFEDGALTYPGVPSTAHPAGKTYTVPSPDAKTGAWLSAIADLGVMAANGAKLSEQDASQLKLDDDKQRTFYQRVLGSAYDEMLADGVSWAMLQLVGDDAYLCFGMDEDVADLVLASLGKAQARENRATRRLAKTQATAPKTAGSKSGRASTATRARTRSPASTRSSTSPTARKPKAAETA